ncbi:phage terminase small subunit [Cellulosilyticum sp. WCF-2]|uniref:phage terminase small subunit n=1 Tax=Cellulosilyticum sp. WCF-2 TaxID=2497860 RepID=UPI000F8E4255|nr:phage terminase small subunit [Cellulosilyticum sp. WCF-2]QEH69731.1 hypothetical protein EKH84_15550 [Cellulosilyticum sp. WCF-2]
MPRIRSPERDKAFEIYKKHGGNIDLVEIASQLNISSGTIRGWKNKDSWEAKLNGTLQTDKRNAPKRKRGAQPGNKTSTQFKPGNKVGEQFKPGHKASEKNGLFAKYLPKETLDIIKAVETRSPLDILWDQIMIAYAAICRAQEIMYVKDKNDKTIEKVQEKDGMEVTEERWEVQQAWDKQANFMKSQARAQSELRSMIKQYNELLSSNPDLATEEQKARIEKLKADTAKVKGEDNVEELDKLDKVLAEIKGVI